MNQILEETEADQEYQIDLLEEEGVSVVAGLDKCPGRIALPFAHLHIPPLGLEYHRKHIHDIYCNLMKHLLLITQTAISTVCLLEVSWRILTSFLLLGIYFVFTNTHNYFMCKIYLLACCNSSISCPASPYICTTVCHQIVDHTTVHNSSIQHSDPSAPLSFKLRY